MGEEVCVWIRRKTGASLTDEELIEFLRDKISHNKIPRYILFKNEHDFPLTPSGKIRKVELRNLSKKELNLESVTPHFNE
uniref:AMP-binding enzyme C-terminal domain-containing protein n=1 Tax=Panagrolaimus davidi TaxID=227884 RepID=A0A914PAW6_9BILA